MDNSPVSTAPPGPNHHHLGSIAAQLRPDGQGYVTRSSFATHSDAESAHHSTLDLELRCGEVPDRRQPNETSKPVTSSQQASSLPLDSQDLDTYGSNRLWSALTRAVPPTSGTLVGFTTTSFVGLKVLDVFAHTASIFSKASFLTPLLSAQSALTVGTREPIRRTHFADRLYVKTPQTILSRLSSYVIPLTTNPQDTRRLNGLNQELVYWHADNDKPKRPIPGPKPCETVLAQ